MEEEPLTRLVIGSAMKVHSALGPGFLESVYHSALAHEIGKDGMEVASGRAIAVHYDGIVVGNFIADLVVEDRVLIELKTCLSLVPAHQMQLVNYLTATGIEVGLLLNFRAERLQFKRKFRTYRPKTPADDLIL